ncbi:MAG: hypothetical protein BWY74_02557 [Firmicutes bacterium ADurb.Bin419]|nr:MAG: hypothetical protein BWY74_02557 [Firmicutes bacterium ADurb.Bin419]
MSDYRYNPNNSNYQKTPNRTGSSPNRPVQGRPAQGRPAQNRPIQGRPVQSRPAPNRTTTSPSASRQLQNNPVPRQAQQNIRRYQEGSDSMEGNTGYEGFFGSEGSAGSEAVQGIEGTQSSEGAGVQDISGSNKNNPDTKKQVLPSPQSNLLDFSDIDSEDILRGLLFSEILGRPKALRRGRW